MSKIEQDLKKFKLQLGPEWRKLHTAKWRRPRWIKFPRSMLDDPHWLRLSPQAAKMWMHILVIASENENLELPAPDILFIRLRSIGDVQKRTTFVALIYELIQGRFLLKTTPEFQSYGASELQSYRVSDNTHKRRSPACSEALNGFASPAPPIIEEKRSGEVDRAGNAHHLGQPKQPIPIPKVDYAAALGSFRPPAHRRCSAFLALTDYLGGLAPELTRQRS